MGALNLAWVFLKAKTVPQYLYSGTHAGDKPTHWTANPSVAAFYAIFGSAVPERRLDYLLGDKVPMRETVPVVHRIRMPVGTVRTGRHRELPSHKFVETKDNADIVSPGDEATRNQWLKHKVMPDKWMEDFIKDWLDDDDYNRKVARRIIYDNVHPDLESQKLMEEEYGDLTDQEKEEEYENHIRMPTDRHFWNDGKEWPGIGAPSEKRWKVPWKYSGSGTNYEPEITHSAIGQTSAAKGHHIDDERAHMKGALERLKTGIPGNINIPAGQEGLYSTAATDSDSPIYNPELEGQWSTLLTEPGALETARKKW